MHPGAGHGHPAVTPSLGLGDGKKPQETQGTLGDPGPCQPRGRFPGRRCYFGRVKQEGEGCRRKFNAPPAGPPPARAGMKTIQGEREAEPEPATPVARGLAPAGACGQQTACLGWVLHPLPPSLWHWGHRPSCPSSSQRVFGFRMAFGGGSSLPARVRARACALARALAQGSVDGGALRWPLVPQFPQGAGVHTRRAWQ